MVTDLKIVQGMVNSSDGETQVDTVKIIPRRRVVHGLPIYSIDAL